MDDDVHWQQLINTDEKENQEEDEEEAPVVDFSFELFPCLTLDY